MRPTAEQVAPCIWSLVEGPRSRRFRACELRRRFLVWRIRDDITVHPLRLTLAVIIPPANHEPVNLVFSERLQAKCPTSHPNERATVKPHNLRAV